MKKLAIIGAAAGQLPLCLKAKQMGIETYCFAWPQGAVCKDFVDYFIPVSISEMDDIVQYCQKYNIDGVVSNASETTAIVASYVADKLGKVCTSYESLKNIQNKAYVREKTNNIPGLSKVRYNLGKFDYIFSTFPRPYVLKPVFGSAKKGINYIDNSVEKLDLPEELNDATFMAETYIPGKEYSVESISYKGEHHVIQVTEKISTGAPHFVELGHHQPAIIPLALREKIELLICKILSELNFTNGATHIEIKISETGDIYLIEVNPRGGGDEISNRLVMLSTGYDYLKSMIEVALDIENTCSVQYSRYAGIYYLCQQSMTWLDFFSKTDYQPWLIEKSSLNITQLHNSQTNYDRDGFIVYSWNKRISPLQSSDLFIRKLNDMPQKYELAHDFLSKLKAEEHNNRYNIPESWIEKILNKGDVLVYMDEGCIQGWIVLYCNDFVTKYAYIAGLHVLSEYRNRGCASLLLEYAITICKNRQFNVLGLYCNNPIAINLYNKLGFREIKKESVKQYGNEVYAYMELKLQNS